MDDERTIAVECQMVDAGWQCHVSLGAAEASHEYEVRVSSDELGRYARGAFDPMRLVAESFRFLLEREGPGSILSTFSVSDIERYFPEFGSEIRRRMHG